MLCHQIAELSLKMCPWRLTGVAVAIALQGPDLLINDLVLMLVLVVWHHLNHKCVNQVINAPIVLPLQPMRF